MRLLEKVMDTVGDAVDKGVGIADTMLVRVGYALDKGVAIADKAIDKIESAVDKCPDIHVDSNLKDRSRRKTCQDCNSFNVPRWREKCSYCGGYFCRDCRNQDGCLSYCKNFYKHIESIRSIKLMRSAPMKKGAIVSSLGDIDTPGFRELIDAELRLKVEALRLGANAVIEYRSRRDNRSVSTSDGGTKNDSFFSAHGIAVKTVEHEYPNNRASLIST